MRALRARRKSSTRELLDGIPGFVFLMDDDVNILEYNASARALVRQERRQVLRRRGGDVFHCVHSHDDPGGCGRGVYCKRCLLRRSVTRAVTGARCVRTRVRMQLERNGRAKPRELYILVSASPLRRGGRQQALVILEDVAELMRLQKLIPICLCCKRVRTAHMAWSDIGTYLRGDLDVLLTNSYCPDCLAAQAELEELRKRAARLTRREHDVFRLVVKGLLNKQVGAELGTAEKTVKAQRAQVMKKMGVGSLAELVRAAGRLGIVPK